MKAKSALISALSLIPAIHARCEDIVAEVANLGNLPYEKASSTVNSIIDQNRKLVATLVDQLRQSTFPADSKVCAIYLLGQLRPKDVNAAQVLLENIDFAAPRQDIQLSIGRWGKYPAQEALVNIGAPVASVTLDVYLPKETNALRRHLMCEVLQQVEGKEIAQNQIKQRLSHESDLTKQTNLEAALAELEK